jgi:hypothetical protein
MSISFGAVGSPVEKSHLKPAIVLVLLLLAIATVGIVANERAQESLPDAVAMIGP